MRPFALVLITAALLLLTAGTSSVDAARRRRKRKRSGGDNEEIVVEKQELPIDQRYRLRGGEHDWEGRVEVLYDGEWGTVCDDGFTLANARVICTSLGWDGAILYRHSSFYGDGQGRILMDDVKCIGQESQLSSCSFGGWGVTDCSHHEDVGVQCSPVRLWPQSSEATAGDVLRLRLPRGHRKRIPVSHGYVEVKEGKKWRKVCTRPGDDLKKMAYVTCGQLGFSDGDVVEDLDEYLAKEPQRAKAHAYIMGEVACTGGEPLLANCNFTLLDSHDRDACVGGSPLIVRCKHGYSNTGKMRRFPPNQDDQRPAGTVPNLFTTKRATRLRAGSRTGEGRVEVLRYGRWGTICHKGWDIYDASVACREMGFGTAKRATRNSNYGEGHGPIWVSDLECHGNETRVEECGHRDLTFAFDYYMTMREDGSTSGDPHCSHAEESGVECHVPDMRLKEKIRLVGGRLNNEGLVEIKIKKKWGLVCSEDWTVTEAQVVCKQLGHGFAVYALKDVIYFPTELDEVLMTGVTCDGSEDSLQECYHDVVPKECGAGRRKPPLAGVMCAYQAPDLVQDIPLLQQSIHLDDRALSYLYCAHEEECLSPSANDADWPYGSRRLLRFSTRVWNRGKADFKPARTKNQWEWHQCHQHFHSMGEFTHYDILDLNFTRVAEGHKASFCLEDSECSPGVDKRYDCDSPSGGEQGIAVGCADNYRYNIDCQWIDITDVKAGNYLLRIHSNPHRLVAESDFTNNQVYCNLQYDESRVWAWNCHFPEDYDAERIARYYTAEVYP